MAEKEVNKTKLHVWAVFKRGYSEGTYPMNVFEFVLILSNTLLLLKLGQANFAIIFVLVSITVIVSMYALGRWNMAAKNKMSLLRADVLADPHLQMLHKTNRDIKIALGFKDTSEIDFWLTEPVELAKERVQRQR